MDIWTPIEILGALAGVNGIMSLFYYRWYREKCRKQNIRNHEQARCSGGFCSPTPEVGLTGAYSYKTNRVTQQTHTKADGKSETSIPATKAKNRVNHNNQSAVRTMRVFTLHEDRQPVDIFKLMDNLISRFEEANTNPSSKPLLLPPGEDIFVPLRVEQEKVRIHRN